MQHLEVRKVDVSYAKCAFWPLRSGVGGSRLPQLRAILTRLYSNGGQRPKFAGFIERVAPWDSPLNFSNIVRF